MAYMLWERNNYAHLRFRDYLAYLLIQKVAEEEELEKSPCSGSSLMLSNNSNLLSVPL